MVFPVPTAAPLSDPVSVWLAPIYTDAHGPRKRATHGTRRVDSPHTFTDKTAKRPARRGARGHAGIPAGRQALGTHAHARAPRPGSGINVYMEVSDV